MGADLIVAIGFMVIVGAIIVGGVWAAFHFGGEDEKAAQAKRDVRETAKQLQRRNQPLPDDSAYLARLRRAKERLARLRDRASGG